jgi:polyhydroxybutyrate depolymerase
MIDSTSVMDDPPVRLILLLTTVLCSHAGDIRAADALVEKTWSVDGENRKALLHVPAAGKQAVPLLFVFHGHGGTMGHAARTYAFHSHWPEALVVYPQGLPTPGKLTDPEGKKTGWQPNAGDQKDRDLKFFDSMLASLKKDHAIDEKRIYCTGHSNGGSFTYLLWAQRGDLFAAVAPSAAILPKGVRDLKPKPVLHLAGEKDPLVKYDWQKRMIESVRKVNAAEGEGKSWAKSGDLTGTLYDSQKGAPVVTLIFPGAHIVPEKAPELIIRFFKEQGKK